MVNHKYGDYDQGDDGDHEQGKGKTMKEFSNWGLIERTEMNPVDLPLKRNN